MKNILSLLVCLVWLDASAVSSPQYFRFKNEMQCADAKVPVWHKNDYLRSTNTVVDPNQH